MQIAGHPDLSLFRQMVQVQGPAAQTRNREYQPICSSKTFTTITDQPCQKEVRSFCLSISLYLMAAAQRGRSEHPPRYRPSLS